MIIDVQMMLRQAIHLESISDISCTEVSSDSRAQL